MKKPFFGFFACFFVFSFPVFGQSIDRSQYRAIDPFDYKLDEKDAARGAVRKFKSVVQFVSQSGSVFTFQSLDRGTTLNLTVTRFFTPPLSGQRVTIYFTATKRIIDALILDDIDYGYATEEGIGLVKSVPTPPGINRASYKEIDPFDYRSEAELASRGDVRRYKSSVMFSDQNGITYYFLSDGEGTMLSMKANQRFPPLSADQRVTVYYTATKGVVDSLTLDDIEF
ncbi:MAG: hypothetical protein LBI06_08695 [Treponema sp.]|jgi:hypothetical protein|nr:hypothetical protein [Treponema sp.]